MTEDEGTASTSKDSKEEASLERSKSQGRWESEEEDHRRRPFTKTASLALTSSAVIRPTINPAKTLDIPGFPGSL